MAFDQAGIEARGFVEGVSLIVAWTAPHPEGTVFQIYCDGVLMWTGTARRAVLPLLAAANVEVGAVGAGESTTDFSADLPAQPTDRVRLTWTGGLMLGATIAGYRIYSGADAGDPVDYGADPLATVPAYAASLPSAGYGVGGYGSGGYGAPAASYSWTSGRLTSGTWAFGVVGFDDANNEGTPEEVTVAVVAPPRPPAADADGVRLHATFDPGTGEATLTWAASPT
jgi:hypothetical protein